MTLQRKIIHVDMDAFYASVEQRDDPALRGKPVIVAWTGDRSVVCAASYEARKFGVRSAMPLRRAQRMCPQGMVVPPDFVRYKAVSHHVREIFLRHTPLVEPLSLDEAYLDVTVELTGIATATEAAEVIRREIRDETSLTASAGVAPNKFLAKIASDWKKPDGLFVIRPPQIDAFLRDLPVGRLPGVGKATETLLTEMGIATVGDLRERSLDQLSQRLGKYGSRLYELSRGIDDHPVVPEREAKSISAENTFDVDRTRDEISRYFDELGPNLWRSLEKNQRFGRTVTVKLRTAKFATATRQMSLPEPVRSVEELITTARMLLERFTFDAERFRLVGLGVSGFEEQKEPQERLF